MPLDFRKATQARLESDNDAEKLRKENSALRLQLSAMKSSNASSGKKAKDKVLGELATKNPRELAMAQSIALAILRESNNTVPVMADDVHVRYDLIAAEYQLGPWSQWAGNIFKGSEFVHVGYKDSYIEGYNANTRKTWLLREER